MKTKLITLGVCCCLALTAALKAQAQSENRVRSSEPRIRVSGPTCTLFADSVPVWLWVFEELEENGDVAFMVYAGKLERGRKQSITSGTERIRYAYKTSEMDQMHNNLGAWCYKGNTVQSALTLIVRLANQ
jgi:hypothetical protein